MALQPQQFNSIFIYYGFMTTAQGKLFKDFWELHSRFLWESTNMLEIFLSKAGNVPLTYICLTACECAAAQNTNSTLNPSSSIPSQILGASTTQAMGLNKKSTSDIGLAVLDISLFLQGIGSVLSVMISVL